MAGTMKIIRLIEVQDLSFLCTLEPDESPLHVTDHYGPPEELEELALSLLEPVGVMLPDDATGDLLASVLLSDLTQDALIVMAEVVE